MSTSSLIAWSHTKNTLKFIKNGIHQRPDSECWMYGKKVNKFQCWPRENSTEIKMTYQFIKTCQENKRSSWSCKKTKKKWNSHLIDFNHFEIYINVLVGLSPPISPIPSPFPVYFFFRNVMFRNWSTHTHNYSFLAFVCKLPTFLIKTEFKLTI